MLQLTGIIWFKTHNPICEKLHSVGEIYFDLIENASHETALEKVSVIFL